MKTKICTKCGKELPATTEYFYGQKGGLFGLRAECKECRSKYSQQYNKEYCQNNREKLLEKNREWYQNNREKKRETYQKWYLANRERLQKYRQNNKERIRAKDRNRRARLLGAEGSHTFTDVAEKYNAQQGKCFYCGCDLNYRFHVDHYIPLSKGGSNDPSNLVIACPTCNLSKKDRLPEEFMDSR